MRKNCYFGDPVTPAVPQTNPNEKIFFSVPQILASHPLNKGETSPPPIHCFSHWGLDFLILLERRPLKPQNMFCISLNN